MVATYISQGLGQSVRACQAESQGLLPLSRITRKAGIKARLRALGLEPEEWHHTGKFARQTDYWKPDMVRAIARMSQSELDAAVERHNARRNRVRYPSAVSRIEDLLARHRDIISLAKVDWAGKVRARKLELLHIAVQIRRAAL